MKGAFPLEFHPLASFLLCDQPEKAQRSNEDDAYGEQQTRYSDWVCGRYQWKYWYQTKMMSIQKN